MNRKSRISLTWKTSDSAPCCLNPKAFYDYQTILFEQDKLIVEDQKPEDLPLDLQAELHLNPVRLSIAYRKLLFNLGVRLGTA